MENVEEFLKDSKTRLQAILDQLNWTINGVLSANCTKIDNQAETLDDNEPPFPPSCAAQNSVVLDANEMSKLLNRPIAVPQKFSDLQINFSCEDKVLLYEHIKSRIETKVPSLNEDADLVSIADIVAMKKREKKNRRKHRVSKPTHTEELRSLVELQMQSLEQHLKNKYGRDLLMEKKKYDSRESHSKNYEGTKSHYSDERRERVHHNEKCYDKAERSYTRDSKYVRRSRSKERRRSYSAERRRNRSKERNRSRSRDRHRKRSKDNHHGKEKYDLHSNTKETKERSHHSKNRSASHHKRKSSRHRSRSRSRHKRSRSHSRSKSKRRK